MRALNVVHYMTRGIHHTIDHSTAYSQTKAGLVVGSSNTTGGSPDGHFGQRCNCLGAVVVDGNRDGGKSEPSWVGQTACFGTYEGTTCVIHRGNEDLRYSDERW